ncbi:MAG: hypothetical protein AAFY50_25340, partial [Cyanobacteria bacterium J06648_1]
MTSSNGNNGDRLGRIESILERIVERDELTARRDEITAIRIERLSLRTEENERNIQALNQATQTMIRQMDADRLKREEEKEEHQQQMRELREIQRGIAETQSGLTKILIKTEENQPTMLRRLMAIENKVDDLIQRDR